MRRPRSPPLRAADQGRPVPRDKSLRTFEFDANPQVDPAVIHTLATCDWVKGLPLCLIGDPSRDRQTAALEERLNGMPDSVFDASCQHDQG